MKQTLRLLTVGSACVAALPLSALLEVDPELPAYTPVSGISGNLDSIGSDTLNNLMTLWAEAFQAFYPNVNIQIEGKGSSTAPPALIEGTARLGPMSRAMKPTEEDQFEQRFGYKPTAVPVSIDALAVYVHKDNPLNHLTLEQIDGIFSNTYKRGGANIDRWGLLGLDSTWANRGISTYGRNSASGTYGFFKEIALDKGDFKATVKEQPGSSAVVQGISSDLYGIGYSGIGYRTSGVKMLSLGLTEDTVFEPNYENCLTQDYPLARFLYVYINKSPVRPLDPLTREFLRFVLSREGQEIVVKDGYYPLNNYYAEQILAMLR
jgi:phosphate transport system substrate-binding protein